jgi:hypothetical protein
VPGFQVIDLRPTKDGKVQETNRTGKISTKSALARGIRPAVGGGSEAYGRPDYTADGIEALFVREVNSSIEGGLLRYSKRLELMDYAGSLGIERFRATLLIAQAQHRAEYDRPQEEPSQEDAESSEASSGKSEIILKVVAAVLMVALIDMVLVRMFFG